MFHWMLVAHQALKSLLPVEGRIRAHQSISETFNTSLWRRKTKPASVNYFAIKVLATNQTYAVHFRDKFLSFPCCVTSCLKYDFSSQCQKGPVSYFNQCSRIFSGILAGQRAQKPISLPPVIASAISSIVFSMIHLDVLLLLPYWLN